MSVDLDLSDSPATFHAASSQTPLLATLADASGLQRIERVGQEPSGTAQGKQRKVAFNQSGPDEEEELPTISPTSIYFNSAGPTSDLAGTRAISVTPASLSRPTTPRRKCRCTLKSIWRALPILDGNSRCLQGRLFRNVSNHILQTHLSPDELALLHLC